MATIRMMTTKDSVILRRMLPIICASTLGTAIEWYDFFFYGFLAVTVFPAVFFPTLDPLVGILAAFSTNFVGFVARPLGGAFFGWFGDRIGRKATLAATLLLMGSATMLMGILPGYTAIGIAAPLLLSLLRFLQGIGLGGEWGGSVLLSMEYGGAADDQRRGFWASWPQTGVPIGLALSTLVILLFKSLFPGEAFVGIGWRIPFLQSSLLMILGLYIRLRIPETPAFARVQREQRIAQTPLFEVVRSHWREILLCTLLRSGETAPFYIFTTFVLTYAVQVDPSLLYTGLALASVVALIAMPTFALISDRIGRKRWFALGTMLMAAFAFPYFLLLETRNPLLVLFALIFSVGICISWLYGPEAALIAERFGPRLRYTGASLGYQLASISAGGSAPIIATYVLAHYKTLGGGFAVGAPAYLLIALYIIFMSIVSCIAVQLLREYASKPTAQDEV
jgi:MFS family permease